MRVCNSRASGRTMDLWLALWALGAGGIVGSERVRVRGHGAEGVGGDGGHSCRAWAWREPAGSLTLRVSTQQEGWTAFCGDLMRSRRVFELFTFYTTTCNVSQFEMFTMLMTLSRLACRDMPVTHLTLEGVF